MRLVTISLSPSIRGKGAAVIYLEQTACMKFEWLFGGEGHVTEPHWPWKCFPQLTSLGYLYEQWKFRRKQTFMSNFQIHNTWTYFGCFCKKLQVIIDGEIYVIILKEINISDIAKTFGKFYLNSILEKNCTDFLSCDIKLEHSWFILAYS